VRACLLPGFGADMLLGQIDTRAIDAWRARMLAKGRMWPHSIQKARPHH
jgi:hypothetical protein